MMNQQNSGCPKCHLLDRSQKISALVEGGTVASVYSATYGGQISGFAQSAKASQLAPPPEPTLVTPWGCWSRFLVGLGLCWGVFFISILISFPFIDSPYGIGVKIGPAFTVAIFAAFGLAISIAIIRYKRKVKAVRLAQYKLDEPKWENAKSWWNQLYYCERDDIVFLPNSPNDYAPASQVWSLCERL